MSSTREGPEQADQRRALRRRASALKASLRRLLKRAAKVPGTLSYSLRRGYMRTRKWTGEHAKDSYHRLVRTAKVGRKQLWLTRRWFRRQGRLLWRLATLRGIDRWGRTRTTKRADKLDVLALDSKPFEPTALDRRQEIRELRRLISNWRRNGDRIVFGPWLTEIGFELLYWVPFLHWARCYGQLRPENLWVVSRGGTHSWYRAVTSNYVDIFDFMSPDEFREGNLARQREQGGIKHRGVSALDVTILDHVHRRIGGERPRLLHPSRMYEFFQPFFQKLASFRLVEAFSFYRKIHQGHGEPVAGLPDRYVAVKLYANDALPLTAANRRILGRLLAALTRSHEVVTLDTGIHYDDHSDFDGIDRDHFHAIDRLVTPADNLDVQTRIIRNASSFYCTYGGFSYLAPLCDTPTVTFYSDRTGFRLEHLELARRIFARLDCPPFLALDIEHLPFYADSVLLDPVA